MSSLILSIQTSEDNPVKENYTGSLTTVQLPKNNQHEQKQLKKETELEQAQLVTRSWIREFDSSAGKKQFIVK